MKIRVVGKCSFIFVLLTCAYINPIINVSITNNDTYLMEPTKPTKEATPTNYDLPQENLPIIEEVSDNHEEGIIDVDERKIVKNYKLSPYKPIILLNMDFKGKTYVGTGSIVAPDTILTAAHNIYNSSLGGWATKVTAYAGANEQKATIGKAIADKKYVLPEWINSKSSKHDLAIVKLKTPLGLQTGSFGITTRMTLNEKIQSAGYPADKGSWTLYKGEGLLKNITDTNIYYNIDTYGGQSGSPVWNYQNKIIGVHAYGSNPFNFGTKITNNNLLLIKKWAATPVGFSYNKEVTLSNNKIAIWNDFQFLKKKSLTNIKLGNVYKAKYIYHHNNGQTYLSLYDNNDTWVGYFNKRDTTDLKGKTINLKVKIIKNDYPIWNNFYFDSLRNNSSNFHGIKLNAKYNYTLGNNEQYYSLYDSKNRWVGYLNKNATQIVK